MQRPWVGGWASPNARWQQDGGVRLATHPTSEGSSEKTSVVIPTHPPTYLFGGFAPAAPDRPGLMQCTHDTGASGGGGRSKGSGVQLPWAGGWASPNARWRQVVKECQRISQSEDGGFRSASSALRPTRGWRRGLPRIHRGRTGPGLRVPAPFLYRGSGCSAHRIWPERCRPWPSCQAWPAGCRPPTPRP